MQATATPPGRLSLAEMAAATPSSRDRYVDFLRALSIAVVVFGHWLMAIVYYDGTSVSGESALAVVPGLWLATWLLQVMPLFFFVGGFSNSVTLDAAHNRGDSYASFLNGRVARLMRPTAIFIGAWMVAALVIEIVAGDSADTLLASTRHLAKPLWFLGVYVIAVALALPMQRLHRRFGVKVPIALAGAALVVDFVRLSLEVPFVSYLNFAFVWLFAHQLGFFYADGALTRCSRRALGAIAGAGLVGLIVLTNIGVYSPSMVGMPGSGASNNDPPSICLVALTLWLVGVAMLARQKVSNWLQRPRAWAAVIGANSVIMTVYLWHLTALLIAVLVFYPIGWPQPAGGTAVWWTTRPAWIAILSVLLAGFVAVFGRLERPRLSRKDQERRRPVRPLARYGRNGSAEGETGILFAPISAQPSSENRVRDKTHVLRAGFAAAAGMTFLMLAISGFALTGFAGMFEPPRVLLIAWKVSPALNAAFLFAGTALLRAAGSATRGGGSSAQMVK